MPNTDVMTPTLARRILSVRQDKERYFAILKLYPAIEAHSADHETVRDDTVPRFDANEIRAMAQRFNRREAHWPLYTYFEHRRTPETMMGQVQRMWYDEKGRWMNAEVELNSADAYRRILKENLGCSLCLARTGDAKSLVEFSFVKQGNYVKSEVTSVYRNSADSNSEEPDPHFPPNHNGVVHFIPLEAGPWIERNSSAPQMEDEQQQQTEQQAPAEAQQPEQAPAEAEAPMQDDAPGEPDLEGDMAEFANLAPEQQREMTRAMMERTYEAERLKTEKEQLEREVAQMREQQEKAAHEQRVGEHMALARQLHEEIKGDAVGSMSKEQLEKDHRALAEELAYLASKEDTSLYTSLVGNLMSRLGDARKDAESARAAAQREEHARSTTRSAASARKKEISNALQKAKVHPMSIENNTMNSRPAKRRVPGGSRLFQSLLGEVAGRASSSSTCSGNSPLMGQMERAQIEAHSARGADNEDEQGLIDQMARRERNLAMRLKRNSRGQAVAAVIEANSAGGQGAHDEDARYATSSGTNIIPFLRQRGLLGGREGELRNAALERSGTANNSQVVIEAHSADLDNYVKTTKPKRKAGEAPTQEERRALMFEAAAAHVDEALRDGRAAAIQGSMLLRDPAMFNTFIDMHLAEDNEIPTNERYGLLDQKKYNTLSQKEQLQNPEYAIFRHSNFAKAEINPQAFVPVEN